MTKKLLSPGVYACEIDSHPIYYSPRQIEALVEAGFITWDQITCRVHGETKQVEGKSWWEVAGML